MEQGPILIRRIEPGDAGQLVAFYAGLSLDSRVARPGAEEIAVATANRLHGRGIARELVKAAAASARRRGVRTWIATMFGGNRAIHRLLQRAGIPWRRKPIDSATELLTMDVAASAA